MALTVFDSPTVRIYQGDALATLQTLPDASVDAVITDPPYSSGGVSLSARQADPAQKYQQSGTKKQYPPMLGDGKDQRSFVCWATMWLTECWRISKDGAPLLVFTDWRQLPARTDAVQAAGFFWQGIVPWVKRSSRPAQGRFRHQCEYVLFASRGRFLPQTRQCLPGVYDFPVNAAQKVHLTSKPVPLLEALMQVTAPEATILDPFLGGGTTALAAFNQGRRCIGVELSAEYAKLAADRLAAA